VTHQMLWEKSPRDWCGDGSLQDEMMAQDPKNQPVHPVVVVPTSHASVQHLYAVIVSINSSHNWCHISHVSTMWWW